MKKIISLLLIGYMGTFMNACIHSKNSVEGQCGGDDQAYEKEEQPDSPLIIEDVQGCSDSGGACSD